MLSGVGWISPKRTSDWPGLEAVDNLNSHVGVVLQGGSLFRPRHVETHSMPLVYVASTLPRHADRVMRGSRELGVDECRSRRVGRFSGGTAQSVRSGAGARPASAVIVARADCNSTATGTPPRPRDDVSPGSWVAVDMGRRRS